MDEALVTTAFTFFPFPWVHNGERHPGSRFSWPHQCNRCDRQCEKSTISEIAACTYGINFVRLDSETVVFGFLVQMASASSAHVKAIRQNRDHLVTKSDIERALASYAEFRRSLNTDIEARKAALIADYKKNKMYESDFLAAVRPEIQRNFSFLHDYKQFIARVRQNINVVLEARYPGGELDQKLERALAAEKAIYWSTILMEQKLQTAYLLLNPDKITNGANTVFRLHGMVIKYIRIYASAFEEKDIRVKVVGASNGEIKGNPLAVDIIPHTFIDNALKYSPRGSEVVVSFHEVPTHIELRVSSFGPRIEQDEVDRIFEMFYRARDARRQEEEGTGFGLYLAQFVAGHMGTKIVVSQAAPQGPRHAHWTSFSVRFVRER